ncbi:MAG: TonB-dependent receptor plug domain-containing protein, partial [Marinirhabdus sp.]
MIARSAYFLPFLIYSTPFLSQSNPTLLRNVFEQIETKHNCTFAYNATEVAGNTLTFTPVTSLQTALGQLTQKTLYNYTLLQDRTIAVTQKKTVTTACVRVFSLLNGLPMSNAVITTPYKKYVTTANGQATLRLAKPTDAITVAHTGLQAQKLMANQFTASPCKPIFLEPKIEYLESVTLSSYLARGITKSSDGSMRINYRDFELLPGQIEPDVLQTVQALPGIQSVNGTVSNSNIRGGTNDQNLILLDGIKMYLTGHFFGLISPYNPFLTQNASVYKNGTGAAYGDGVSGTVFLNSKRELNDTLKASLGSTLIAVDGFIDAPLGKKASVQVSARRSYNDLIRTPTYSSYFKKVFQNTKVENNSEPGVSGRNRFMFYDASIRLLYNPSAKDKLRINLLALGNDLRAQENFLFVNSLSRTSELQQSNISASIFYDRDWNRKLSTYAHFYSSSYGLEAINFNIGTLQRLQQKNNVLENVLKLGATVRFSETVNATLGHDLVQTGVTNFEAVNNPFFSLRDKQLIVTNSVFGELQYRPKKLPLVVVGGLRANHFSKFETLRLEPRFTLNYRFWDYFTFELLGEMKSQAISQITSFQSDFLGVENRRWILASPNEQPIITSGQVSTGLSFNRRGFLVNVEPYLKRVKGIAARGQGFQNQFLNKQFHGSYTVKGVDVLVKKTFRKLDTWLSYSYATNNYFFAETAPQRFPNNLDITHALTYGANYTASGFKLSAGLTYRSGRPYTLPVPGGAVGKDGTINFESPNAGRLPEYVRVAVSGNYNFSLSKTARAKVGLSVLNLLNKRNTLNRFYRVGENG